MSTLRYVRTGKTSYLKMNEADYKAWLKAGNTEYGDELSMTEEVPDETPETPAEEAEAKAAEKPAENKAKAAPVEKKARG